MNKAKLIGIIALISMLATAQTLSAHCDTMDGPVVKDAHMAFQKNNVNYILKWVKPDDEDEIRSIFHQAMRIRPLNNSAKELAEKFLIENLVRLHRAGEGVPYEGVKPSGSPISEMILAADKSIEIGNMSPLKTLVAPERFTKLNELFNKVMSSRNYDVNEVKAGREYVEAYVQFFHFAEGEEESHGSHHGANTGHLVYGIPMVLSVVFFIMSAVFAVLYYRMRKKLR
jgi:hypothetical protein